MSSSSLAPLFHITLDGEDIPVFTAHPSGEAAANALFVRALGLLARHRLHLQNSTGEPPIGVVGAQREGSGENCDELSPVLGDEGTGSTGGRG